MKFNPKARKSAGLLFKIALEKNVVDVVNKDMDLIKKAQAIQPQVWNLLSNPAIPLDDKLNVFQKKLSEATISFLKYIIEKREINRISTIADEFSKIVREYKNIEDVLVETAFPLDKNEISAISEKLSAFVGRRVELDVKILPELIGGVILHLKDRVIDLSYRTQLKKIKECLRS
ncbi:MAG: ATP synthase F1 subunit delta [Elusimicrobiota bacterium]